MKGQRYLKGSLPKMYIIGKITPIINALNFEGNPGVTKVLGYLYQVVYHGSISS